MDTVFPLGFPGPTALYLSLYVGTLAVHAVLMSYVLAGTGYVAALAMRRRDPDGTADPAARVIADWLPFALGTAITAGVAPLLFLQILYKESFYTANLLLFHRWMAMVPVLVVGFYLLYLIKSRTAQRWPRPARVAVAASALGCFVFAAWSWTGNHLLSLDRARWAALYTTSGVPTPGADMLCRLGLWLAGAVPVMAVIAGWQLRSRAARSGESHAAHHRARRRLAALALAGVAASAALGLAYARMLDVPARAALTGSMATPYLVALGLGLVAQSAAWIHLWRARQWSRAALILASAGMALAVLGTAVVREAVRLAGVDVPALAAVHARVAASGGIVAFFVFLVINAALIAWCLRATRRALRAPGAPE